MVNTHNFIHFIFLLKKAILYAEKGFLLEDSNDILAERYHRLKGEVSKTELLEQIENGDSGNYLKKDIENIEVDNTKSVRSLIDRLSPWYQPIFFDRNISSNTPYSFNSNWGGKGKWETERRNEPRIYLQCFI